MTTETFTPEHARLIYDMYRKILRKMVNAQGGTQDYAVLSRQFVHWGQRWMAVPDEVAAKAL